MPLEFRRYDCYGVNLRNRLPPMIENYYIQAGDIQPGDIINGRSVEKIRIAHGVMQIQFTDGEWSNVLTIWTRVQVGRENGRDNSR